MQGAVLEPYRHDLQYRHKRMMIRDPNGMRPWSFWQRSKVRGWSLIVISYSTDISACWREIPVACMLLEILAEMQGQGLEAFVLSFTVPTWAHAEERSQWHDADSGPNDISSRDAGSGIGALSSSFTVPASAHDDKRSQVRSTSGRDQWLCIGAGVSWTKRESDCSQAFLTHVFFGAPFDTKDI